MKKFLCLLALLAFVGMASAQEQIGYFAGAWYETKVPITRTKDGGHHSFAMFDNGQIAGAVYFDGEEVATLAGTWTVKRGVYYLTLVDSDGWTWKATLRLKRTAGEHELRGTFRSQTGQVRGSWMGS